MQFIPFVSLIFVSHLIKMVSNIGHWMKIIHILLLKATGHIFNNIMIQCFESFCYFSKPFSSPVKNISQQKMPVIYASNVLQCYSKTSCRILRSNIEQHWVFSTPMKGILFLFAINRYWNNYYRIFSSLSSNGKQPSCTIWENIFYIIMYSIVFWMRIAFVYRLVYLNTWSTVARSV